MRTKQISQASVLSSLIIVLNIITFIIKPLHEFYLEFLFPASICVIYLLCGFKYTLLGSFISAFLTFVLTGSIFTGVFMIQGIFIGVMCGYVLSTRKSFLDNILKLSIFNCFIILFIDLYFSKLIGYSFINDFKELIDKFPLISDTSSLLLNVSISMMSIGYAFTTYIISLTIIFKLNFIKNSLLLNLDNDNTLNFFLSIKVLYYCLTFIFIFLLFKSFSIKLEGAYLNFLINSITSIIFIFIIYDSIQIFNYKIHQITKIKYLNTLISLLIITLLIIQFEISLCFLVFVNFIIKSNSNSI